MDILIYAEVEKGKLKKDCFELASYASQIADNLGFEVHAVCFNADKPEELSNYGIKKIYNYRNKNYINFDATIYSDYISKIFIEKFRFLILSSSSNSRYLGGILSIILNASYISNVISKFESNSSIKVIRNSFTNKAFETVEALEKNVILSIAKNSFEIIKKSVTAEIEEINFEMINPMNNVTSIEKSENKVSISDADIVVSGGRGLKGPENWHLIEDLANVLGGATACSKPVSDLGWRPHSEHVGQTGKPVSSNLYVAIGISGAIQHLAGVNASKTKLVINTDPEAPFFKAADYGIVGDAFEVVPDLINKIKKFKSLNS
jgi:electron transfer flavoprotein alpha subunit